MSYGPKQSIAEGFNKFVVKNHEGCWGWTGCAPKNPGYGQFRSNMKNYRAHIASWLIHKGEIPKGMCVCHTCDNKICSNPDHLFIGTVKDNNIDMMKKGRSPILGKSGYLNPNSKLSANDILEIDHLLKSGFTQTKIAEKLKVSQGAISNIKTRKYRGCLSLKQG